MVIGFDFENIKALAAIISAIYTLNIILSALKIKETKIYRKIVSKTYIFYYWAKEKEFLIKSILGLLVTILVFSFSVYNLLYPSPEIINNTFYPKDFVGEGSGAIFTESPEGYYSILINNNQFFFWKKGWQKNQKLLKLEIEYNSPGTQLSAYFGGRPTSYILNGSSPLVIENPPFDYDKTFTYYLIFKNIGSEPLYIINIKTYEEVSKPKDDYTFLILISYLTLLISLNWFRKYRKKTKEEGKMKIQLLGDEAKFADRIKNIEFELRTFEKFLKELEKLNLKKDISPNFYEKKKAHYAKIITELKEEKKSIESEIEEIIIGYKRDL